MKLADPNAYYADRAVEHIVQGDIYNGIPLVQATHADLLVQAAGSLANDPADRNRPLDPAWRSPGSRSACTTPADYGPAAGDARLLTRAPTDGADRLLARASAVGMANNELRKIRDGGMIQGFMYLPQVGTVLLDGPEDGEGEWTGHAASLIYRPSSVTQALTSLASRVSPPTRRGFSTRRS